MNSNDKKKVCTCIIDKNKFPHLFIIIYHQMLLRALTVKNTKLNYFKGVLNSSRIRRQQHPFNNWEDYIRPVDTKKMAEGLLRTEKDLLKDLQQLEVLPIINWNDTQELYKWVPMTELFRNYAVAVLNIFFISLIFLIENCLYSIVVVVFKKFNFRKL